MVHLASALARTLPLAGLAVAAPAISTPFRRQTSSNDACAEIGRAYDEAVLANTTNNVVVKPSVAYECLRSIPVDVERDIAIVEYIRPWLEFQSTIGILPNPPEEYLYPGVDIFGGFDNITSSLENGGYESQLDFTVDLYRLINVKPRDGHLAWFPALALLINFSAPALFVSISEDGVQAPKIYLHSDYERSLQQGYNASEVKSFDNSSIADYLQQRAVDNSRDQDPDAAYNEQLYSAALANVLETTGARRYYHTTLSDESVIEFTNGTEATVVNTARVVTNFSGIDSGSAVHDRFEVPGDDGEAEVKLESTPRDFSPELEGYPLPFVIHEDRYISGYVFNDSALEDAAVLAVNSFVSQNNTRTIGQTVIEAMLEDPIEFGRVAIGFVEASRRQGKSKLILDLQGNGGGLVANAMALYGILFPEGGKEAHMNMRVRAHQALDWVGSTAEKLGVDLQTIPYPVGFSGFVDEDLKNFTNWQDFYGPEKIGGEEYTNIVQPTSVATARDGSPGVFEVPEPWFKPEDTVIVTDGHCASACAYIVGMMTRELGIQVIAMGGRPIDAPMQAVGGTKGGPVLSLNLYQLLYPTLGAFATPPDDVDLTPFAQQDPPLAGSPTATWTINSANVYLDDDLDGTPVQFRYEAANCKLYYTWDTLTNMTSLWAAVAGVKWNGGRCVAGSTTNDDGTMGSSTVGYSDKVVSGFQWAAGPGDVIEGASSGNGGGGGGGDDNDDGNGGGGGSGEDESAAGSLRAGGGLLAFLMFAVVLVFNM
ncbi:Putative Tail specific protease, ClpP/crotonase-like domain superfamily [Colletotrichum destructivum]|uniref:Tail specific protease, ClpP/crotonase-like domain superfamily n=1 Tax=Colletotrichum destructivum TaxID=34406 RepID=A0AAX4HWJ4_9PEZI|nr:Putative Tail specific protease, ClpP/crotonase-like domain superfamily [Colletotrichum destructivum]